MKGPWRLIDGDSGEVVVPELEVADRWWERFRGLQFRRLLPPGTGLLLVPCSSIHTCWLRFPIAVMSLDRHGRVIRVRSPVSPWRVCVSPPGTYAVLETAPPPPVEEGVLLRLAAIGGVAVSPPESLRFLVNER